ncbi:HU family DNA-binding protein [Ornithinimicrobium murale]|uniref:HU family DNA-binding protein n=1 Tax=Ornithinimicrobium murale TaxID=1050153 RepID=UPI000E0DD07B|nr:HU family DNA-binding protein [Ornithinimicrobium murale]
MNKAELIDRLSTQLGSRRDATLAVEALVDVVIREVTAGGSVGITGFGTFERADRAPRTGRNPRTGESVPIAGTSTPRFRPGTYFKQVVNEPKALPSDGLAGGRAPAGGVTPRQAAAKGGTRKKATSKATGTASRGARKTTSSLVAAEDVAAVETELKDSARKTLKKSHEADKKSKKGKGNKSTASDKGKKKDKKSKKK